GPLTKVTIFKDREEKPKSAFVCFDHPESKPYALLNGICSYGRSIHFFFPINNAVSPQEYLLFQRVFSDTHEIKSCSFLTTRRQCHLMHTPLLTLFVFQI
ncbi:hypothetical protein EI555_021114, partial [Monodon monoceros]